MVTHGNLASALIETSKMIVGEQKELYAVELGEGAVLNLWVKR